MVTALGFPYPHKPEFSLLYTPCPFTEKNTTSLTLAPATIHKKMQFLTLISKRYINRSSLSRFQSNLNLHISSFPNQSSLKPHKPPSNPIPPPPNPQIQTLNSTDFTLQSVKNTITSYSNDWNRAFEFFNWVETHFNFKHNNETYNQMINVLGKFFEFDLAWKLINKMNNNNNNNNNNGPDHTTFRIMFKRYAAAHMVNEAIDTFNNRIKEFGLKDEVSFGNLIDGLCDYKHVIEAEELCMGKDSPYPVNTKLYNMILRGWFVMGKWAKCREFWEKMEEKGVERDLHTYSIYMNIVCKSGKPWKAVKLYKEMKMKGVQLDVVAYNTVIGAIGEAEGVDVSTRVLREMIEMRCKPNVVTYNTIIKLLCKSGRYEHAYGILEQMPEKGCFPDVMTYHCFFSFLSKPKEILKLFDKMVESGIRPRMDTYVMLLRKFGRWGFLRPVFIVWEKMKEHGCSPDACAYNALIDALIQKNMFDMAREYDEEMLALGLSAKRRRELVVESLDPVNDIGEA